MEVLFAIPALAGLPDFKEDYGKIENLTEGSDVEQFKKFIAHQMFDNPTTTAYVFGTERTWKSRSSFPEFRAIIALRHDPKPPNTTQLYLVVMEGRFKETRVAVYRLSSPTLHPQDFDAPILTEQIAPLPSAEEMRMLEKYPPAETENTVIKALADLFFDHSE